MNKHLEVLGRTAQDYINELRRQGHEVAAEALLAQVNMAIAGVRHDLKQPQEATEAVSAPHPDQ